MDPTTQMNRLHYAISEQDADLLYATGFQAPDAFLYFEKGRRRFIALNQLEYDRGRRQARVDRVLNLSALARERRERRLPVATPDLIAEILRRHQIRRVTVSPAFPLGLAQELQRRKLRLDIAPEGLFPERRAKAPREIAALRHALKITALLLRHAIETLRRARVRRDGVLTLGGHRLTSERVQNLIRMEAARHGFEAQHPIVAGGAQGCDPHERGHGPLRARELIILDIFPRDLATGYWGDMTRTVIKGRPTDAQRKQFETVRQAQRLALTRLRAGVGGRSVHAAVEAHFEGKGYPTGNASGVYEGFFHGTGHGLGLEIHEAPRVSAVDATLRSGDVVTVEPGLYYRATGGVRIEDVVRIRRGGCDLLSRFPVQLEIDA